MDSNSTFEVEFNGVNFSEKPINCIEYESCNFLNCNFSGVDLSETVFIDCDFHHCDLSNTKLIKTAFREVRFHSCKMVGLHFGDCNDFLLSMNFTDCQLDLSSFYKLKIPNTKFINSDLKEVDFVESDLSGAEFSNCNLQRALFENTNLEKADFRTSFNYIINPLNNKLKKTRFSKESIEGLLNSFDIIVE